MIRALIFFLFVLQPEFASLGLASEIWVGENSEGFTYELTLEEETVEVGSRIFVNLQTTAPTGFQLDLDRLKLFLDHRLNRILQQVFLTNIESQPFEEGVNTTFDFLVRAPGQVALNFLTIPFYSSSTGETVDLPGTTIMLQAGLEELPSIQELAEGPVDLSLGFPYRVNSANQREFLNGIRVLQREANRNVQIVKDRSFPYGTAIALFLLLLFSWVIYRIWTPLKQRIQKQFFPPPTAESMARKKLKQIRRMKDPSYAYVELSDAVRSYLEQSQQVPALHMTTKQLAPIASPEIERLLEQADRIKFSGASVDAKELQTAFENAERIVGH